MRIADLFMSSWAYFLLLSLLVIMEVVIHLGTMKRKGRGAIKCFCFRTLLGWFIVDRGQILCIETSLSAEEAKEKNKCTFFRYLVVVATASIPFLIALVLRWCNTT
jgi:hypothetical protein